MCMCVCVRVCIVSVHACHVAALAGIVLRGII